jgi:ATP-dependent Clp protease ATP-binding subunit ClpA
LVERCVRDAEVTGSNPAAPTTSKRQDRDVFSRFSPAARRVLRAAEQECRNHNHYYVGAEHMLFALLEEHDPQVEARLADLAVDVGDVHANVKRALGTGEDRMWEGILVTPRFRKIVELAEQRAGDQLIEPVDLLEAIRAEGGGMAAEILARAARA